MRTESAEVRAGGKGIDSARVAKSLNRNAPLIIFMGDRDASEYERLIDQEKLSFQCVYFKGSIRVATMYMETTSPTITIINEEGPTVSVGDWEAYLERIQEVITPGEMVLCMGSFPAGVDEDEISALINMVHHNGSLLLMDSPPHYLKFALAGGVDIISPNLDEAEALINSSSEDFFKGESANGVERAKNAALKLISMGTKIAIVHAGELGSAIAHLGNVSFIPTPEVKVLSPVGAGDSLAAGFALKSEEQGDLRNFEAIDWKKSMEFAVATAAAACEKGRAGDVDSVRVYQLFEEVLSWEIT